MISSDSSSGRGAGKILLAGDISRAFFDAATVCGEDCEVQVEMRDAISSAAENSFAVIGVVISGSSFRLGSALKAFRQANPDARIILLAQMYEEPLAIELLGLSALLWGRLFPNSPKLVNTYSFSLAHRPRNGRTQANECC